MTIEIFDFWFEFPLLAVLACLLVYWIFDTRLRLAHGKGADAVALLRRNARRIRVLIAGTAVIMLGILISPLPGPGLSVLGPLGLTILAGEFVWARKLATQLKERSGPIREATQRVADATPRWAPIPACVAYWCATIPIELWTSVPSAVLWPAASIVFSPVLLWAYLVMSASRA